MERSLSKPSRFSRLGWAARMAALAIVYLAAAKLGLAMDAVSGFATLVWPPTGVAFAALLLFGLPLWPGVWVGAFIANMWTGAPALVAGGIATGNTLEAVVGATLLIRVLGFHPGMAKIRDAIGFVFIAAILSTAISATVGVSSLLAGHVIRMDSFAETWRAWWLGDVIGALVLAPLLLTWTSLGIPAPSSGRLLEVACLSVLLAVTSVLVFGRHAGAIGPFYQPYLLLMPVIWSALRFDQRGATATTFTMSVIAIVGTAFGMGPFVQAKLSVSLSFLQVFVAVVAITALLLAAVVAEREARSIELAHLNQELAEAVRARDGFLSVASHELRTPLGVLQLQTQLLLRRPDELSEGVIERVRKLDRQALRLNRLVDRLLEVSRIASGRLRLEPERVDLAALVKEVGGSFEEELGRAGCALSIAVDDNLVGYWDPLRLEQVVSNLLSNAIKYGADRPIEIDVTAGPSVAKIVVTDHGIGIAPEHQSRIFDRFERVVPQRHAGGFGLGLWIAREIVQAMGGSISLSSALGSGSSFTVELPMPERVSAAPDVGSGDGAQEPDRILIVEDDQDILDGLTEILESEGYGVVCAHNGREALECIKRVRPSVVLLDLTMPMMDGAQFLERIRLKREFAELPIVLISADGNLREKARSLGVSRYLEKPIQIAALLDAVKAFRGNARGS